MAEWKKVVLDGAAASLASLTLTTDLTIPNGGTGANSAAGARTNLGLVIGTNVQAQSAVLDDLNTLGEASADGEFIVATGAGAFAYESGETARTSLGLGTVATRDTGIGENNIPIFEAGAADDDFLRINGSTIEGRSASEVRGDISAASRGANSDITSLSGLTTALSTGQGGTGLKALATAGTAMLSLAFGDANKVLAMNETANGLVFVDAADGDITGVTAGTGLSGGGTSGSPTLNFDPNSLTAANVDVANDSIAIIDANDSNAPKKEAVADLVNGIAGTNDVTGLVESSGTLNVSITALTNLGGATLADADEFMINDNGVGLKAVTFGNLEDSIFANVSGDATIAAGGALTIGSNTIEGAAGGGMLNDNIINAQTDIGADLADGDELLVYDATATRIRKTNVTRLSTFVNSGNVTSVTGGTGITSTGGTTPSLSVDAAQTGITSLAGVNTINASGTALALGSTDSDVTVNGNLVVKGTASFEDAETLRVKDPMIILSSGSNSANDGGFIVQQSSTGKGSGQFFGYDASAGAAGGRFGVKSGIEDDATAVTLEDFVTTVSMSDGTPVDAGAPTYGGAQGYGAFAIDTTNHDMYVYISS